MTNLRRSLALVASVTIGALLLTATPGSASARTVDERCLGRGPIPASALGRGVTSPACPLVGRVVPAGPVSGVVPPAGMSVAGEGVGRHGESRSLRVTNTGTTVRVVSGGAAHGATPNRVSR